MTIEGSPYYKKYAGSPAMALFDQEENALRRWFNNYKVEQYAYFCTVYECLIVEEVPFRGKTRYVCKIEFDNGNEVTVRQVLIEPTAPKPPLLTFAAKEKYVPPPPKTATQLARERAWAREADRWIYYNRLVSSPNYFLPPTYNPPTPPPTHRRNV